MAAQEDHVAKALAAVSRLFTEVRVQVEKTLDGVLDVFEDPPVTGRCSCGHLQAAHSRWMGVGPLDSKSACTATTYENIEGGMNSWPCTCTRFDEEVAGA